MAHDPQSRAVNEEDHGRVTSAQRAYLAAFDDWMAGGSTKTKNDAFDQMLSEKNMNPDELSNRANPTGGTEPPRARDDARRCAWDGCTAILSRYNKTSPHCAPHERLEAELEESKREAEEQVEIEAGAAEVDAGSFIDMLYATD